MRRIFVRAASAVLTTLCVCGPASADPLGIEGRRAADPWHTTIDVAGRLNLNWMIEFFVLDPHEALKSDDPADVEFANLCCEALLLADKGNAASAVPLLDRIVESRPTAAWPYAARGFVQGSYRGDPQRAVVDLSAAIRLNPNLKQLYCFRGFYAYQCGDRKALLDDLATAIALDPQDNSAYLMRGVIRFCDLKDTQGASEDAIAALRIKPDDAVTHNLVGCVSYRHGDLDRALAQFEHAIRLDSSMAEAQYNRGLTLMRVGKALDAIGAFNSAVELGAMRQCRVLTARAVVYEMVGDAKRATRDYDSALQAEADFAVARYHRGNLRFRLGMLDEAYQDYLQASDDDPTFAPGWFGLGCVLLARGRHSAAVADYESAITVDAQDTTALNDLAWLLATSYDEQVRNGAKAVEYAMRANLKVAQPTWQHMATLAAAYAELGNFAMAVEWQRRAIEAADEPSRPRLQQRLADFEAGRPYREPPVRQGGNTAQAGAPFAR